MGLNDLLNTGLVLGLGINSSSPIELKSKIPQNLNHLSKFSEPSLTLSLSGETSDQVLALKSGNNNDELYGQDSPKSSSLSNLSVKRERENIGSEEIERMVSSRASDEDEDGSNGRKKLRLTKAQSALLEENFKMHSTLNPKEKQELARELKLRPRQVEVWFQNRRARTKLKQTEIDYEFLKKCCETLTDENRRLQKELHDLKSSQPLFMHLPSSAALTMCPSCQSIGGAGAGAAENAAKSHFITAPKPQFYNPFINPSAAC